VFSVPLLLQLVASCAHQIRTVCVCATDRRATTWWE
jgi:hypothetical protein